jgi:hypothetical protein
VPWPRTRAHDGDAVASSRLHPQACRKRAQESIRLQTDGDDHAVGRHVARRRQEHPLAASPLEVLELAALDHPDVLGPRAFRQAGDQVLPANAAVDPSVQACDDRPPVERGLERGEPLAVELVGSPPSYPSSRVPLVEADGDGDPSASAAASKAVQDVSCSAAASA